jgi:hypothetical protein
MRASTLLLVPAMLMSAGCIEHTARIQQDPARGPEERVVIGTRTLKGPAGTEVSRPQPVDLPISAWELRGGTLARCEDRVRTPLPWWQRFPCDIATDLLPIRYPIETTETLSLAAPAHYDDDALTQEARRHGFAHD